MFSQFLLAVTQAVTSPPIVVPSRPSPPPAIVSPGRQPVAPTTLELRVTAGPQLLWEGSLRVGVTGGVYRQDLTQAPAVPCPPASPDNLRTRSGFVVAVASLRFRRPSNQYQVTVNWSRPSEVANCTNFGARSVELNQTISLDPGQEVALEGDAGLVVRIRRTD